MSGTRDVTLGACTLIVACGIAGLADHSSSQPAINTAGPVPVPVGPNGNPLPTPTPTPALTATHVAVHPVAVSGSPLSGMDLTLIIIVSLILAAGVACVFLHHHYRREAEAQDS